jgi:hypothetical protein
VSLLLLLHPDTPLGAGSFGQVYLGHWHQQRVAVKMITYDCRMAERVSNEVRLIMSFDHPNIVKAYHFRTYMHDPRGEYRNAAAAAAAARIRALPTGPGGGQGLGSSKEVEDDKEAAGTAMSLAEAVRHTMAHLTQQQQQQHHAYTHASNVVHGAPVKQRESGSGTSQSAPHNLGPAHPGSGQTAAPGSQLQHLGHWEASADHLAGSASQHTSARHFVIDITAESGSSASRHAPAGAVEAEQQQQQQMLAEDAMERQQQQPSHHPDEEDVTAAAATYVLDLPATGRSHTQQQQQHAQPRPGAASAEPRLDPAPCYLVLDLPEELTQGKWVSGSEALTSEHGGSDLVLRGTEGAFFSCGFAEPTAAAAATATAAAGHAAGEQAAAGGVSSLEATASSSRLVAATLARPAHSRFAPVDGAGSEGRQRALTAHEDMARPSGAAVAGAESSAPVGGTLPQVSAALPPLGAGHAHRQGPPSCKNTPQELSGALSADLMAEQAVSAAVASYSTRSPRCSHSGPGGSHVAGPTSGVVGSMEGGHSLAATRSSSLQHLSGSTWGARTLLVQEYCDQGVLQSYAKRWQGLPLDCPERVVSGRAASCCYRGA